MKKEFDVIVFGATGFTGRLVAEYLNLTYGTSGEVVWAMAGRNATKLSEVRSLIGVPASVALITVDANDADALAKLVARTKVVITTVGPYQLYGEALIRACVQAGTDYVDLCGEPGWMAEMIPQLQEPARASGARIVFSCGFDSIPFDLGVTYLQEKAMERFSKPATRVHGRVRVMKGKMSGGTLASALATIERMKHEPQLYKTMVNPFALTPGFKGPIQPEGESALYDDWVNSWTGPFVMATINTKNIHRTNLLLSHAWGKDFVYDERMMTGDGDKGMKRAKSLVRSSRIQNALLAFKPTREFLRRFALPKPGEGPDKASREAGRYEVVFVGETSDGQRLKATVKGDRDPGYGSTCKMIAESALCLVNNVDQTVTGGGVWTPGSAMGMALVQRLEKYAGLSFVIEDKST